MQHCILIQRVLKAAPLLLLSIAAHAQPYSVNRCVDSLRIWPPVRSTTVSTSTYRFQLDWDRIAGNNSCYPRTPSPIVAGQDSLARWVYFWDFGDGTFSRDSAPSHVFKPGTYTIKAALKPTYSDDDDPVGFAAQTITVSDGGQLPSYPTLIPAGSNVALNVNWPASRPGGYVVLAITYPKITGNGQPNRIVYLAFPEAEFTLDTVQTGPPPVQQAEPLWWDQKKHVVYAWRFTRPDTSPTPNSENTLFIHLRVKDTVADSFPSDTSSVLTHVLAMIQLDDNSSAPDRGNILGAEKLKQKGEDSLSRSEGILNSSSPWSGAEVVSRAIALNWASDPNYIDVWPKCLLPGSKDVRLNYTVGFYNGGSATADTLRVNAHMERAYLHAAKPVVVSSRPIFSQLDTSTLGNDFVARWSTNAARLPSLGQAQSLGFDSAHCFGEITFQILTRPGYAFQVGDAIRAIAHLRMERDSLCTNTTTVRVCSRCVPSPWFWGIKVQHNATYRSTFWEHLNGQHVTITLRRPLGGVCGLPDDAIFARTLPKSAFPLFWWQGELGYGRTHLIYSGERVFQIGHVEVTPLLLRFIARQPQWRVGSLVFPRSIGLSAGYTASVLVEGKEDGTPLIWSDFSWVNRIDHSLSLSFDWLNLIGKPGLSLGVGWQWRNTALPNTGGGRVWYAMPFFYAHYTLR